MFRLAEKKDAAALLAVYAPYVENTVVSFEYTPPTAEEFAARIAELEGHLPWIIAEHQGKVLGYVCAHPYASREAYQWSIETSIYLSPEVQRLGVGRRLYDALFELLALQGYTDAWAIISQPNPGSEAFHKAYGFAFCGELAHIGYKQGQWLGVTNWHKSVIPGDAPPQPLRRLGELNPGQISGILARHA